MKRIFLGALAATLFFSCSKENDEVSNMTGDKALVNISVTSPETKAATTGAVPTDVTVANFTVFIITSAGEIGWSAYSATGADLNGISVNNTAQHVFVVANAGNLTTAITSKTQLDGFLANLNSTTIQGGQASARWATGSTASALSFTQDGSGNFEADASVELTFIAARITLKIVNNMYPAYNANAIDGSLVLNRVAVLNARGESKLFGTSLIPAAYTDRKSVV